MLSSRCRSSFQSSLYFVHHNFQHLLFYSNKSPNQSNNSSPNHQIYADYLVNNLGFSPRQALSTSTGLRFNLEKRLLPRHRVLSVLKEKGLLDYKFYTATLKTEKQFLQMLEPFMEDVPGLLELYHSNKGCSDIDTISK